MAHVQESWLCPTTFPRLQPAPALPALPAWGGEAKPHFLQSLMYQWCPRHFEEGFCARLCQQPAGEGKVCWCVATSRNGGTGPASAPTLTRCSCTLRACLHIKGILHHWTESSVLMAQGCPGASTALVGRVRTLLHHTQSGEAGAACSQWHQQLLKCCVWENNLAAPTAHAGWARSCTSRENGRATAGGGGQGLPSALQGPNPPAQEVPRALGRGRAVTRERDR